MNFPWTGLSRQIAAVLAFFMMTVTAYAACSDLRTITPQELEDRGLSIAQLQTALRTAYRDPNERNLLGDGTLGVYTRQKLEQLCEDVPRPPGQEDVSATLNLVKEYAETARLWPGWAPDLYGMALLDGDGEPVEEMLGLRLAASLPMKTVAMGRRAAYYDCTDPVGALADYPNGARALGTLTRLLREKSAEEICALLPVAGGVADWQQAMERLGQIATGARAGALQTLQSGDFMRWIDEQAESRLRRLVGTVPAVLALLDEYGGQSGSGGARASTGDCRPRPVENTVTYYTLTQKDVDELDFLVSLTPKLEAFRAEQQGFDNPQALWRALEPVLTEDLDDCILRQVEELVKGPDRLPLAFLLRPSATEALMAQKALEPALPVLTELAPLRTSTKAELINRIRAGLQDVQEAAVAAEVTAAADTLAAASEPASPVTDTALIEPEEDEEEAPEDQPAPMITVTDATDAAVESAIDNPELAEALRNTPMTDATVPELIRSQVRRALEDTAARQAQRAVEDQITRIEPAVTSEWALTEALLNEIRALPDIRAVTSDATAEAAQDRLLPLIGVSYPSLRLFKDALQTVSLEQGKVPFSDFVEQRIIQVAQKTVDKPAERRVLKPLQIEDCQCAPKRKGGNEDEDEDEGRLTVYGFYPFWLALTDAEIKAASGDDAAATDGGDAAEDPQATPPQQQTMVDFGAVDQIAFYGLEIDTDADGRATLHHRQRWREARETFVNSAHKYRARADLAIDLRGWTAWDATTIDEVAEEISTEMAAFDRIEGEEPRQLAESIPTLFDHPQPDGVTLIFHDYDGVGFGSDEMDTMIRIIKRIYESLPDRERQKINVAFDFPLTVFNEETKEFEPILDKPVFDALFELVQNKVYVMADAKADTKDDKPDEQDSETIKIIDKILLFLERPTTDSKKGLRFRMEQGLFQGELRRQVLRSIIPVVPPAGHREVRTFAKPNDPNQGERPQFSQFEDDVVYFKDNFTGIGFWPVPDPLNPETKDETERLFTIISTNFNAPLLPKWMSSLSAPTERYCTYICPNRAAILLGAAMLFTSIALLTWRSFYSGPVYKFAFRFLVIGSVRILYLVLVAVLLAVAICDPHSNSANWLVTALIVILAIAWGLAALQRIKNGPMP